MEEKDFYFFILVRDFFSGIFLEFGCYILVVWCLSVILEIDFFLI